MWCCIQMNKELPVSKSKSVRNIYPAKLESGGNGFKSCFVQISTKHSSQPLTEYQFCFFSYFPRVTGNSFVKTLRKKKKVLVQIFLLYVFVFLNLTGSTPLQFLSFWPQFSKKLIHPQPKDTPRPVFHQKYLLRLLHGRQTLFLRHVL